MATYGKTRSKTAPVGAIAAAALIVAVVAGCNGGGSGSQYYPDTGSNPNIGGYLQGTNQGDQIHAEVDNDSGPGITTDPGGDAGEGGDYDGSG